MNQYTLNDHINEQLQDPEFAAEFRKEELKNAIAELVYNMRKHANLNQSELAIKAKTSQPVIARLEGTSDSRIPSLELLTRVASACGAKLKLMAEY